ncbi:TRM11 family SAM-dependent methyltransferase [Sedimentisphaera salicampi]|uniref:Putative methyltransferase n=1 Tax=Sedimentisphaera salicampi TaxID=1941349 RepID=A0A1W6LM35_9BACT|nr:DNA methyltransferase [Sedimentisphaera salicampi]ARN56839.1 putative methyltransferase [Sedimentisphaera salicampi]
MPEKPNRKKSKKPVFEKPALQREVTTLWDYPSQNYAGPEQGDTSFVGATPSYVIWNLLERYTKKNDLVVDPMCGSGTTLDVARDLGRKALGYDVSPTRPDIFNVDARKLPLEDEKADFVFVDPPYSTHIDYSEDQRCIGKLHAGEDEYYQSMRQVLAEIHRVLKPGKFMGLYVCDSFELKKGFFPIGFELFSIMREKFTPADIVSVVRRNKTLEMGNYRKSADEQNFFLRGFNYLFIMQKPKKKKSPNPGKSAKRKRPAKKKYAGERNNRKTRHKYRSK